VFLRKRRETEMAAKRTAIVWVSHKTLGIAKGVFGGSGGQPGSILNPGPLANLLNGEWRILNAAASAIADHDVLVLEEL